MNNPILYALAVPLLSASGGLAAASVFANFQTPAWVLRSVIGLALLTSGAALYNSLFDSQGLHFGFVTGLMCVGWVAALVAFLEGFFTRVSLLEMVVFPFCAMVFLLPWFVRQEPALVLGSELSFQIHLLIAIAAYSLLGIAAIHAVIMAWQGKLLHEVGLGESQSRQLREQVLDHLPPLLSMEATLFRQLWAGFGLLSLTLLTGFGFASQWGLEQVQFNHKLIFSVLAWLSFAVLLVGRHALGWRGSVALRWCLGSYSVLFLAYFGTQFVLEFVLGRAA